VSTSEGIKFRFFSAQALATNCKIGSHHKLSMASFRCCRQGTPVSPVDVAAIAGETVPYGQRLKLGLSGLNAKAARAVAGGCPSRAAFAIVVAFIFVAAVLHHNICGGCCFEPAACISSMHAAEASLCSKLLLHILVCTTKMNMYYLQAGSISQLELDGVSLQLRSQAHAVCGAACLASSQHQVT
jgi:hypothetical protein